MPRHNKGDNKEGASQKLVHSYLEKLPTHSTPGLESPMDAVPAGESLIALRTFLSSKFDKTNENIKQVDSRLTLIN